MRGYHDRVIGASVSKAHKLMMNTMLKTAEPTIVPETYTNC